MGFELLNLNFITLTEGAIVPNIRFSALIRTFARA